MNRLLLFTSILLSTVFLSGCEETVDEVHQQYVGEYGWTLQQLQEEETYTLAIPEEMLANYEVNDLTFLRAYLGQTVTHFVYTIKERDTDGTRLQMILFESDGVLIGGYGRLPSWDPGVFHLQQKQRLIDNGQIKP